MTWLGVKRSFDDSLLGRKEVDICSCSRPRGSCLVSILSHPTFNSRDSSQATYLEEDNHGYASKISRKVSREIRNVSRKLHKEKAALGRGLKLDKSFPYRAPRL